MQAYVLSTHAVQRSAQRNLSDQDIEFIMRYGERVRRTGVIFCQLRSKNVPRETPGNHRLWQLTGTTIVLCKCGRYVVTLYRQERAFQRDSRKSKYGLKAAYPTCPHCGCNQYY